MTSFEKVFVDAKLYGGTFMVKSTKDSEVLPLHQDWSVVDEDIFSTYFIWSPLQVTGPENGGLFVLEGSHNYFNVLRSGSYPSNRYPLPPELHQFTKNIHLKPGQAILYSDQLFHGSYANSTEADRIVATARVMNNDAPLVYFDKHSENQANVYEGTPKFYLSQIDRIAKGLSPVDIPVLYTKDYHHVPITDEALQAKIREQHNYYSGNEVDTAEEGKTEKRPLWKVYTPANIFREIKYRLTKSW